LHRLGELESCLANGINRRITNHFRELLISENSFEEDEPPNRPANGMSVAEKMALWSTYSETEAPVEPDSYTRELDVLDIPWRYGEVRSYILEGPAYKWLLENMRSTAILSDKGGTVLDSISKHIHSHLASISSPKSRCFQLSQAKILMNWDLPRFLKTQEYGTSMDTALERAITITGVEGNA
jgi:hypothetical protein